MSKKSELEKANRELKELRAQNRRLENEKIALLKRIDSEPHRLTRRELEDWMALSVGSLPWMGAESVPSQVLGVLDNAAGVFGKEAVRRALYLDDPVED